MNFGYNRIPPQTVGDVELISRDDPEYVEYKRELTSGKTQGEIEREKMIATNREKMESFESTARNYIERPEELISDLKNWVKKDRVVCGNCIHSRSDDYRDDGNAIVCWENQKEPATKKPRKLWRDDDFAKGCESFTDSEDEWGDHIYRYTDDAPEGVVDGERESKIYMKARDLDEEESGQKEIRKWALRIAWNMHGVPEDWNYQRAEAFLRDLDSHAAKTKGIVGSGGREFEDRVQSFVSELGLPQRETVLRIETKNDDIRYKEMDVHTEIDSAPYIIEIFTSRSIKEKENQLWNYSELYEIATGNEPEMMLLTNDSTVVSFDALKSLVTEAKEGQSTLSSF